MSERSDRARHPSRRPKPVLEPGKGTVSIEDIHTVTAVAEALRAGHPVEVRLWGGSMRPWIRPGARLRFVPTSPERLLPGDVVLVLWRDTLLAHRLVARHGAWLLLRGDALALRDPEHVERIHARHLLGRAAGLPLGHRCWPLPRLLAAPMQLPLLHPFPAHLLRRAERRLHAWAVRHEPGFGRPRRALGRVRTHLLGPEDEAALRSWLLATGRRPDAARLARWRARLRAPSCALWGVRTRDARLRWVGVQHGLQPDGTARMDPPPLPWSLRGLGLEHELIERAVTRAAAAGAVRLLVHPPDPDARSWRTALREGRFDPCPLSPETPRRAWARRLP